MANDDLRPDFSWVTPTRRLAHYLRRRFDEACAGQGLVVWRTPDVVTWSGPGRAPVRPRAPGRPRRGALAARQRRPAHLGAHRAARSSDVGAGVPRSTWSVGVRVVAPHARLPDPAARHCRRRHARNGGIRALGHRVRGAAGAARVDGRVTRGGSPGPRCPWRGARIHRIRCADAGAAVVSAATRAIGHGREPSARCAGQGTLELGRVRGPHGRVRCGGTLGGTPTGATARGSSCNRGARPGRGARRRPPRRRARARAGRHAGRRPGPGIKGVRTRCSAGAVGTTPGGCRARSAGCICAHGRSRCREQAPQESLPVRRSGGGRRAGPAGRAHSAQ